MNKVECVAYWPTRPGVGIADVKESLPAPVRDALMSGSPPAAFGIYVDVQNHDVIHLLDTRFGIGRSKDFIKDHVLEVDKRDIPKYSHFFILPQMLDRNKDAFFALDKPACNSDTCPWDAKRTSDVMLGAQVLPKLGIARLARIWEFKTIELVISAPIKNLFEREGISGLEYEPCRLKENGTLGRTADPVAYVAKIIPGTYQCGKDITPGTNYCQKHSIVLAPDVFERWIPSKALLGADFQRIDSVRIGQKEYYYYKSLWVVSQRALQLLLDHKVTGLEKRTIFLNEKFRPLLIT